MDRKKHGFRALKFVRLFSLLLLSKPSFFHEMDKFIPWQRLVPVLIFFLLFLFLFFFLLFVGKEKCACPSDKFVKYLLVCIKFLLVPNNSTLITMPSELPRAIQASRV